MVMRPELGGHSSLCPLTCNGQIGLEVRESMGKCAAGLSVARENIERSTESGMLREM